jgi:hypothetical protein
VTIGFQLADRLYRTGAIGVVIWYALAIVYFAAHGRKQLVYSPLGGFHGKASLEQLTRGVACQPGVTRIEAAR